MLIADFKEQWKNDTYHARNEGLAEGLEKGKAEGEHNAKLETAKNLQLMGLTIEQISKATGLSIDEIKKL